VNECGQRVSFNQHEQRDTDHEAAGAELAEQLRLPKRPRNEPEISACVRGDFEACLEEEQV
jgi:hypothetical protein